jgi:phosphoesterase RecJ-like protein
MNIKETVEFLQKAEDILILAHQNPDGDTIGSSYALAYAFDQLGKRARIECCDMFGGKYTFLGNSYTEEKFEPKTIITVDVADPSLLGDLQDVYGDRVDLSIDHHISNTEYARLTCVDADAAACSELMYRLLVLLDVKITSQIAQSLYTGIITDTGCFRFSNTTAETHRIAANLLECRFAYDIINRNMFEIKTMERIRLEAILISEMETYFNDRCHLAVIRKEVVESLGLIESDLEGITAITTQVGTVSVGVLIKEKAINDYRVSLRSTGIIDVSKISKELGGGGHVRAAGCAMKGTIEQVKETIIEALSGHLEWGSVNADNA